MSNTIKKILSGVVSITSFATIKTKKQYPFNEESQALEKDWLELYFDIVKTEKNLKQQTIENARK